jgi:hypothetical protein
MLYRWYIGGLFDRRDIDSRVTMKRKGQ